MHISVLQETTLWTYFWKWMLLFSLYIPIYMSYACFTYWIRHVIQLESLIRALVFLNSLAWIHLYITWPFQHYEIIQLLLIYKLSTRTNEPMDPRLLLQLSAKNNQRKTYIYLNKMKEDYPRSFNPSLGNIYTKSSVTFEPLCTLKDSVKAESLKNFKKIII